MATSAEALKRTLAFFEILSYAPTRIELLSSLMSSDGEVHGQKEAAEAFDQLVATGVILHERGRCMFPDRASLIEKTEARVALFPRKLRRAMQTVRWLRRIHGVRFVALCNTMALMNASDASDIDFFIITKSGQIAQTRIIATLPFKFLKLRPNAKHDDTDAICLSFFLDETALDFQPLMHLPDDPYMRLWFLHLLPLHDDGIGTDLWATNQSWINAAHPLATAWQPISIARQAPFFQIPTTSLVEQVAVKAQHKAFSSTIKTQMNQGTEVMVTDHILKFHVQDGREGYRRAWQAICKARRIAL